MRHLRGLLIQQVRVIAYDSAFITGFKWCDATSPRITLLNNKDLVYRFCSLMYIPILIFKKSATLNWSDFFRIWHNTWPVPPSSFPTIILLFSHNTITFMDSQLVSSFLLCPRFWRIFCPLHPYTNHTRITPITPAKAFPSYLKSNDISNSQIAYSLTSFGISHFLVHDALATPVFHSINFASSLPPWDVCTSCSLLGRLLALDLSPSLSFKSQLKCHLRMTFLTI